MIRAARLEKQYGDLTAVHGIDLDIRAGEFFGLLGPNGAGKTTTVHMLATLLRPSAGSATVAGVDVVREATKARASIGVVFQESGLDRNLSIAENLRFAGLLHDLPSRVIEERQRELLGLFGLADRRDDPVASLSGGMRRLVDIARGVLHHPKCLFLDEPTLGLDIATRRRIWRWINRLRARTGMTVVLTTHYLEEAEDCDRVAFIRDGRLVDSGAPLALIDRLGQHIVEVEGPDADALADLERRLGACLRDGDRAYFRCPAMDEQAAESLRRSMQPSATAWRIRRPNLNDVFIWLGALPTR